MQLLGPSRTKQLKCDICDIYICDIVIHNIKVLGVHQHEAIASRLYSVNRIFWVELVQVHGIFFQDTYAYNQLNAIIKRSTRLVA